MKLLRWALFPFGFIYYLVVKMRNLAYDLGIFRSKECQMTTIAVGNLSTGGTGKSPMVEFLVSHFKSKHKVATLSRGYGRKSKGFYEVSPTMHAAQVGDEPLQFKRKFTDIPVVVSESRNEGITKLKEYYPELDLIILDDAYQHRKVKAAIYLLLTKYDELYIDDFVLPVGNLREPRAGAKRADGIVVTKCPEHISQAERTNIIKKLKPKTHQRVFFSSIKYSQTIVNDQEKIPLKLLHNTTFSLVTGIANPKPLVQFLTKSAYDFDHLRFSDHHNFTEKELQKLDTLTCIVTTEKDYIRLQPNLNKVQLYYLPITITIIEEENFTAFIKKKLAI